VLGMESADVSGCPESNSKGGVGVEDLGEPLLSKSGLCSRYQSHPVIGNSSMGPMFQGARSL
jgi:hypothetical protein